ncbi:hypothetical protein MNBD_DELTA01-2086 [hydrothermal vent metagenome]|uniref:Rhodanese domain-containing protein n=1 Tax=hydrothermal vent metagenome TaxID=652676 RepID=A0A3B0RFY6_9ZZZZ
MYRRRFLIAGLILLFVFIVSSPILAAGGHDHSKLIDVPRITVMELKSKMKRGDVVYVMDLRAPGSYSRSPFRIPGDIRFTLPELRTKTQGLPKNAEIATYCT